jgi:hypothetical protein
LFFPVLQHLGGERRAEMGDFMIIFQEWGFAADARVSGPAEIWNQKQAMRTAACAMVLARATFVFYAPSFPLCRYFSVP